MTKFEQIEASRARREDGKVWPVGDRIAIDEARKQPRKARFLAVAWAVVREHDGKIDVVHDGLDYETADRVARRLGLTVQRIRYRHKGGRR